MNIFKTKVFRKLFFTYSGILTVMLVLISLLITNNFLGTMKRNQMYLNRKMVDEVNEYLNKKKDISDSFINLLYRREVALTDTINFLEEDYGGYLSKRLNSYSISDENFYDGISFYVQTGYSYDKEIAKISFWSFEKNSLTVWGRYGGVISEKEIHRDGETFEEEELKMLQEESDRRYDFKNLQTLAYIRRPSDLRDIGAILLDFELKGLIKILSRYENIHNRIVITDKDGCVQFDSEGILGDKDYTWEWEFRSSDNIEKMVGKSGLVVMGILPQSSVISSGKVIIFYSIMLSLIIMVISLCFIYIRIHKLSIRTDRILNAMAEVKEGRLDKRIEDSENDEISLIAENFNQMCSRLQEYINRAFISEIKQKNAQLLAVESQINPHFLYNTLEAIRMKALINGDDEVSSMLYSMSVIYRNITKGERIISLKREIEHCRLYLELFKFRFEDRLNYYIHIDDRFKDIDIIKLTVQPIIENFLVHGMRKDAFNNFISITVCEEYDHIVVEVEDNGKGIAKDRLDEIRNQIKELIHSKSIGLVNIQERLKLSYGDEYGIEIDSCEGVGTKVEIHIPKEEVIKVD